MSPASLAFALLFASSGAPDLRAVLEHILHRPEWMPELKLRELTIDETHVAIGLELPPNARLDDLPVEVENAYEEAVGAIAAHRPSITRVDLAVAHPGGTLRPPLKISRAPVERGPRYAVVPDPMRFPDGQALMGRTIAISAGHGYIYYDNLAGYSTQRGRISWTGCGDCRGIVEDFETHEIMVRYLIPLLEGAGARVVMVRERDYNGAGTIVEETDPGYAELGGTFFDGTSPGGHRGGYRATGGTGGQAEFTITAPLRGRQILSSWFVHGMNRSSAVEMKLTGPFGVVDLVFDQKTHGRRWTPIALFDLDAGDAITVQMNNPAADAMITDAIRLGAGMHSSNHLWWEMGAFPFAEYQEAPTEILAYGDVTIRPRCAEFYGADIYFAMHSNASGSPDSTAAGTSSYRYNCGTFPDHSADPPAADCDDPPGSDRLQALVHAKMVEQIRAEWDPNWLDRGPKVANFGELRELDGIPGMLMESAFHDQVRLATGSALKVTDNQSLHDPRWRRATAFGIYAGITEYFGATEVVVNPPKVILAKRESATSISVDFESLAGAARYRIYTARGGLTFDLGRIVNVPPAVIEGLTPEEVVYVRIAALNAAGEGLPSAIVAVRPSAKRAQVLLVDSFEREDAWIQDLDNLRDTLMTHAAAMAQTAVAFDGASETALAQGKIALAGYDGVVFALGAESTEHEVLSDPLRVDVRNFAEAGGAVFASGSEILWALDARGDDPSRAFLADLFGASYGRDDAGVFLVTPAPGGWIAPALMGDGELDDGTKGALRARSSDVLNPLAGSTIELLYGTGMEAAAVRKGENLLLGFALDSLTDPAARAAILGAFIDNAIPNIPIEPEPDAGAGLDASEMQFPDADSADTGNTPADTGVEEPDAGVGVVVRIDEAAGCSCRTERTTWQSSEALTLLFIALFVRGRKP